MLVQSQVDIFPFASVFLRLRVDRTLARNIVIGYIVDRTITFYLNFFLFSLMECSIYYHTNWFVSKYGTTQVSYY